MGAALDIARGLSDLMRPALWGVAIKAVLLTLALLVAAFWGGAWALGVGQDMSLSLPLLGVVEMGGAAGVLWLLGALAIGTLLITPVAALFIGFLLDEVADAVEARSYPGLPPARPAPAWRQVGAALRLLALMLLANFAGLFVWLLATPLAPLYFLIANGWLIGREYFELVASRRLDPTTAGALRRAHRWSNLAVGACVAAAMAIPVLNLIAPLAGVAAVTHQFHRIRGEAAS
ncbi:MAG: EI24 domain-containing protein [Rubrimonas sp.]